MAVRREWGEKLLPHAGSLLVQPRFGMCVLCVLDVLCFGKVEQAGARGGGGGRVRVGLGDGPLDASI